MANLWDPAVFFASDTASYWNSQLYLEGTVKSELGAALVTGSSACLKFTRTVPAGFREDLAMFRLRFSVEAGPGAPMSRLDTSDADRVKNAILNNWSLLIVPKMANDWTFKEIEWRHFGADFPLGTTGLSKESPPWYLQTVNIPGSDTAARLPDQVALSTTLRTGSRKHWGRFYMGGFTTAALADAQQGHAVASLVDNVAALWEGTFVDLYNDARKTFPVVWSSKYRGALTINELAVDDVWDVIRRRRAKQKTYAKVHSSQTDTDLVIVVAPAAVVVAFLSIVAYWIRRKGR